MQVECFDHIVFLVFIWKQCELDGFSPTLYHITIGLCDDITLEILDELVKALNDKWFSPDGIDGPFDSAVIVILMPKIDNKSRY